MFIINTPPPAAGGGATDDDWVRVDLTDSADPWTKSDPDTTGSSITARSVTVDTTSNSKYVDGCVHYRELKTPEGNDFDYTDKPVTFQGFVMLPNTGWADSGGGSGGVGNPATASRSYVLMGVCTDPENLPLPLDCLGCGLEWQTSTTRLYRSICRNVSNSAPAGVIDTNKTGLRLVTHVTACSLSSPSASVR